MKCIGFPHYAIFSVFCGHQLNVTHVLTQFWHWILSKTLQANGSVQQDSLSLHVPGASTGPQVTWHFVPFSQIVDSQWSIFHNSLKQLTELAELCHLPWLAYYKEYNWGMTKSKTHKETKYRKGQRHLCLLWALQPPNIPTRSLAWKLFQPFH